MYNVRGTFNKGTCERDIGDHMYAGLRPHARRYAMALGPWVCRPRPSAASRKYGAPLVMSASTHGTTSTASDQRALKQTGGAGESVSPAYAPPGALRRRSAVGETGASHPVSLPASLCAVARIRVAKTPPTAPRAACLAVAAKRLEVAPRRVRLPFCDRLPPH